MGSSLLDPTPYWELLYLLRAIFGLGSSLLDPGLTGLFLLARLLAWFLATEVDLFYFLPDYNWRYVQILP